MPPINTQPNIELTLNGLVVVFADPDDTYCSVGLLRDAPEDHALNIEILKADANGELQPFATIEEASVNDKLEITVNNTSKAGISRRKMDLKINRKKGPTADNRDSFRWVVDFESEIYKKPIGAKKAGFASILKVNNGELLTRSISTNKLRIRKGQNGSPKNFGQVATKTGIDIVLDQPNSRAVFKNGDNLIFEADNRSSFQILINRGCSNHPGNDADSYYTAVGHKVSKKDKIFFSSTSLPPPPNAGLSGPIDPDAKCLNTQMSQSQPD